MTQRINHLLYRSYRFFYTSDKWRERRITRAGAMLLIFMFTSGLLSIDTYRASAYQIFPLAFFIFFFAVFFIFFFKAPLKIERRLPPYATVGEKLTYRLVIFNLSQKRQTGLVAFEDPADPRPTFEELLSTPEPDEDKRYAWDRRILFYRWLWLIKLNERIPFKPVNLPAILPNTQISHTVEVVPIRRGIFQFEGITIACPEPFGLFRSLVRFPIAQKMVILPKRYHVPLPALPGSRKHQPGGVSLASSVGNSDEFAGIREYRPGDPKRLIHWRSFAKYGKPIIKEYQDEYFVRHALILDTFFDHPKQSAQTMDAFEEAVSLAASFVSSIETRESLLDLIFIGDKSYCFSMGRGLGHMEHLLEVLACVKPVKDKSFDTLSPFLMPNLNGVSGCICLFLSWNEARQNLVRLLKSLSIAVSVFWVTAESEIDIAQIPRSDLGPMADTPSLFFRLQPGRIQEGLNI